MTDFSTPMMKQYTDLKNQYPDCLLFFRLGDFYELFMEDAKIGAQVLDITLTARDRGRDGQIPMAGVPFHAVDSYLSKLVKAGYKVAICEQLTEPDGRGIVERDVVRVVTPGTVIDESSLERKENNYIISLSLNEDTLGIAAADVSTGHFYVSEHSFSNLHSILINELTRLNPTECVLPVSLYNHSDVLKTLKSIKSLNIFPFVDWDSYASQAEKFLKRHFKVKTLAGMGIEKNEHSLRAAAGLLGYLKYTQKDKVDHINTISHARENDYVELDRSTILNLELFGTLRDSDKKASLNYVLDHTLTAMGGRLFKNWIIKPLNKKSEILSRQQVISEFLVKRSVREDLRNVLNELVDVERLLSRISVGIGNARDLISLKIALEKILLIKTSAEHLENNYVKSLVSNISLELTGLINLIEVTFIQNPPFDVKKGGIIKPNVNPILDNLNEEIKESRDFIFHLENKERERTGINSLKVKYNMVFGYYIEITKSNLDVVPKDYLRKQTLVNAERFITPELKHHEDIILTAEEKIHALEYQIFLETVEKVLEKTVLIQNAAAAIAELDCLLGLAVLAEKENYVCPEIIETGELYIKEGRHPVVEKMLESGYFVPNDVLLDSGQNQLLLITGPNMAGKSVFMRQVGIIVLMAHIGSFVPASQARISLVDKIFVRSGAADAITSGLSTFMVEMVETANILNNATSKSLIIMDEIGRGTSTYDGISIAWAVAEYLVTRQGVTPKTLFATHYHELQKLEEKFPNKIKNLQVLVEEKDGELVFLHTVAPGAASHSYGISVADLAGVPKEVTEKAIEVLATLEEKLFVNSQDEIVKKIRDLNLEKITPLEAVNFLDELKKQKR